MRYMCGHYNICYGHNGILSEGTTYHIFNKSLPFSAMSYMSVINKVTGVFVNVIRTSLEMAVNDRATGYRIYLQI